MKREIIDKILEDIGLEPLIEEDYKQLKTRPVAEVIKQICTR